MKNSARATAKTSSVKGGNGEDSSGTGHLDSIAFSRPTSSPAAEKNTVVVKTSITDSMNDDLQQLTRKHGYTSTSDCMRELLKIALYGKRHVLDVHAQRIEALALNLSGNGPEPDWGKR